MKQFFCQEFKGSSEIDKAPFSISVWTSHGTINEECSPLFVKHPDLLKVTNCKKSMPVVLNGSQTLNHFNHSSVLRAIEKLGDAHFANMTVESPTDSYRVDRIECNMDSVYM